MMWGRNVVLHEQHDELGDNIEMDLFELTIAEVNNKLDCNTITLKTPVFHNDPMRPGVLIQQPSDDSICRLWKETVSDTTMLRSWMHGVGYGVAVTPAT